MGKIRVRTLGDEEAEKKQKEEERKRREAKIAEAKAAGRSEKASGTDGEAQTVASTADAEDKAEKPQKKDKFAQKKSANHSTKYQSIAGLVDKSKLYAIDEALAILPKLKLAKFDETVELHINTTETGMSGAVTLPHGTGKAVRVVIANATKDAAAVDELVKEIEAGKVNFDILIATPDSMPKLARVAKFLGPRGLMPNPKNGTVTPNPDEVAKKFEGGQINFKTEAKFPIMHLSVGKVSFGDKKLSENIKVMMKALDRAKVKNVTLKSTMSPGLRIDMASL
jgi:large subunit ribosomal protein L1